MLVDPTEMSEDIYADCSLFGELICLHRAKITRHSRFVKFLICAGMAILLIAAILWVRVARDRLVLFAPSIVTLLGVAVNAAALVPYRNISPAKIKILLFEKMKQQCELAKNLPDDERKGRMTDIVDYLNKLV